MEQLDNFRKSLQFTLKWEGGYINDPDDPGGETKWGISKRAYPNLDIGNLTPQQAADIYAKDYWDACGCDAVPFPLCTAVFDTSVLCGVSRARNWLRKATDIKGYIELRKQFHIKGNPKYVKGWLKRVGDLEKFVEINNANI